MKQRSFSILLLLLGLLVSLSSTEVKPFLMPSARELAMGGPHAALADDFGLLFSNPAALARAKPELYASQLGLKASGPLFDMAQAFLDEAQAMDAFLSILDGNSYQLYTAVDIQGPVSFGYIGKGIGFGFFNRSILELDATGISSVSLYAAEDVLLVGGYAFAVNLGPHSALEIGILAKGFIRGLISTRSNALDLVSMVGAPLDQPFSLITGIGVDAGIRWAWTKGLSAGLSCRDLFSPALITDYESVSDFLGSEAYSGTRNGSVERDLSFGMAYAPSLGRLGTYLDTLVIALDYRDILDLFSVLPRNPILNLGLGVETGLLDVITLRFGIRDALLNAGIGLDLGLFRFNLSSWGEEKGLEPGAKPVYNLMTSLEFRY